uniref:Uncharacterized protein n=1 Tax=Musca domestica TaxID=7370 RepID=A0A1I8NK27_MUSDO
MLKKRKLCDDSKQKVVSTVIASADNSDDSDADYCANIVEGVLDGGLEDANSIRNLGQTIRKTLFEINEIRERNRERRHKELMEILSRMLARDSPTVDELNDQSNVTKKMKVDNGVGTANVTDIGANTWSLSPHATKTEDSSNARINASGSLSHTERKKPDEKSELQIMRLQMLEMQRQKMEDRERKSKYKLT